MIVFEVNQKVGRTIPKTFWQKVFKKASKVLKIRKSLKVSIALVGEKEIKNLNRIYRGKNSVTDVLSFAETKDDFKSISAVAKNYIGEIIICYPRALKQAKENKQSLKQELSLLLVHGLLHLLGYHHQTKKERKVRQAIENKIIKARGIS